MSNRFGPLGKAGHAAGVAALSVLLLTSSTSAAEPAGQTGPDGQVGPSPSPVASAITAGPIASAMTPVPADPGYTDGIVALGLDAATADFMAQTLSTVEVVDGHTYEVHHAFPNGATGDVTYRLTQGGGISPTDPPVFNGEAVGDEYRYTLRYAIDPSGLPLDLRSQLLDGLPNATLTASAPTAGTVRLLGLTPLPPVHAILTADSPGAIDVVVDGLISQTKDAYIDKWVEHAKDKGFTKSAASFGAFKAGKKVWEAVELNDSVTTALEKLKALRKCAENPTNPLTKKAYGDNPQEQQSVLDDLTRIENDIRDNAMVLFSSLLTDTGSSLIKTAPWLGFVTGPANDYVKGTLQDLMNDYLRQAEQRVVPCGHSYSITGSFASTPGGTSLSGKACSLEKKFTVKSQGDLIGTFTFRPSSASKGKWDYKGRVHGVSISVDASGAYTVHLAKDNSSGTLHFVGGLTFHAKGIGDVSGGGPADLTLTEIPLCAE